MTEELSDFRRDLANLKRIRELEAKFDSQRMAAVPPQPPRAISIGEKSKDAYKAGIAGIASFPGLLVDAVNWPLKKMGIGVDRPFGGSQQIYDNVSGALGVKHYQPIDDSERYAMGIARAGGASTPVLLPLAAMVGATGGIGAGLASLGIGSLSTVTGGIGSEFGGELAKEIYGEDARPYGELLGGLVGGQTPYTAAGIASKSAGKLGGIASKEAQQTQALNEANKNLGRFIAETPNLDENIALANKVSDQMPGFQATLAGRTQSPGIQALSRHLESTDPSVLNQALSRAQSNEQAIDDFAAKKFPSQGSVTNPAAKVLEKNLSKIDSRIEEINRLEAQLAEKFPRGEQKIVGQGLAKMRDERALLVKKKASALYDDLYATADAQQLRVPLPGLVKGVQSEIKKENYNKESLPGVYDKILEVTGGKAAYEPSFREFHELIKATGRELGIARRGTDTRKTARLERLYGALNEKLKEYEGAGNQVSQKLQKANDFYKNEYQKVFKEGVGGLMKRDNRWGSVTPEEDIVRRLVFKPDNAEGVDEFFRIYGDDPKMRGDAFKLLHDGIIDLFSRDVVKDGVINISSANNFLKKYKQALDRLPGISAQLKDAKKVQDVLLQRRAEVVTQQKELSQSWVSKIANTPEEKVPELISKAMEDKNTLMRLVNLSNDAPADRSAVIHAVAKHVDAQRDPYAYIKSKREYLTPILGNEHVSNLEILAGARKIQKAETPSPTISVKTTVEDAAKAKLGSSYTDIAARYRAMAEGRTGPAHFIGSLASKFGLKLKEEHLRELYKNAIYDPDIAKTMASLSQTKNVSEKQYFKVKAHLFGLGLRVGSELTDEDLEDPRGAYGGE